MPGDLLLTVLAGTKPGDEIALDTIGEAIGARAITSEEIDVLLTSIEKSGRKVVTRAGGRGEANLKRVLDVARTLRTELGRVPRASEIAAAVGPELSLLDVQHALALVRTIQR